ATNAGEVDANLVGSPSARMDAAERVAGESFDYLVKARRFLAVVLLVCHDHLDAIVGMMADASLNIVAVAIQVAGRDGDIFLEDLPQLELHAEVTMSHFVLGHENHPAGVAVEPVYDASPVVTVDTAQLRETEAECVDQCPAPIAARRVNNHVIRLV